jgi:hypothetical protein
MPTVRRKIPPKRPDQLSIAQRSHLLSGGYILPLDAEFDNERHRRLAWEGHGASILEDYDRPGHRPRAFWDYQVRGGWRRHGASEQEAVHKLLSEGRLPLCPRMPDELAQIKRNWLHEVRVSLVHSGYRILDLKHPLPTWGTPVWFYAEHAPTTLVELEAERRWPRQVVVDDDLEDLDA